VIAVNARARDPAHPRGGAKGQPGDGSEREKLRAMAVVHDTELVEIIVDAGEPRTSTGRE
jgi:hypothetical protein